MKPFTQRDTSVKVGSLAELQPGVAASVKLDIKSCFTELNYMSVGIVHPFVVSLCPLFAESVAPLK